MFFCSYCCMTNQNEFPATTVATTPRTPKVQRLSRRQLRPVIMLPLVKKRPLPPTLSPLRRSLSLPSHPLPPNQRKFHSPWRAGASPRISLSSRFWWELASSCGTWVPSDTSSGCCRSMEARISTSASTTWRSRQYTRFVIHSYNKTVITYSN